MSEIRCNPLSDMGKMKETLVALLGNNEDMKKLGPHITDATYVQGNVAENESGIFIDTYLRKVSNQRLKEVGTEIYVVCHKDALTLSEDEKTYFRIHAYGQKLRIQASADISCHGRGGSGPLCADSQHE